MNKKKISKGRRVEKIKKRKLNEVSHLEMVLVGMFLLIGLFTLLFSSLELNPIKNLFKSNIVGQSSKVCIDSDSGINAFLKGNTKGTINGEYTERADICVGNTLKEYYCDIIDCHSCIYSKEINCPNACNEGGCI